MSKKVVKSKSYKTVKDEYPKVVSALNDSKRILATLRTLRSTVHNKNIRELSLDYSEKGVRQWDNVLRKTKEWNIARCTNCGSLYAVRFGLVNVLTRKTTLCPECASRMVSDTRKKVYLNELVKIVSKEDIAYIKKHYDKAILNCCYKQTFNMVDPLDVYEHSYLGIIKGLVTKGILKEKRRAMAYINKCCYYRGLKLYTDAKKVKGFDDLSPKIQRKYMDTVTER